MNISPAWRSITAAARRRQMTSMKELNKSLSKKFEYKWLCDLVIMI